MALKKGKADNRKEDKKKFADEQTDKRNHEHLSNEKDEISEQDIRNIKTDVTAESVQPGDTPDK